MVFSVPPMMFPTSPRRIPRTEEEAIEEARRQGLLPGPMVNVPEAPRAPQAPGVPGIPGAPQPWASPENTATVLGPPALPSLPPTGKEVAKIEEQPIDEDVFLGEEGVGEGVDSIIGKMSFPVKPNEPSPFTSGAIQESGPVRTQGRGVDDNKEAPRVAVTVGGRTFDYATDRTRAGAKGERIPESQGNFSMGDGTATRHLAGGTSGFDGTAGMDAETTFQQQMRAAVKSRMLSELDPIGAELKGYEKKRELDEKYRTQDRDQQKKEVSEMIQQYESDVRAMQQEGGDDAEERVREATQMLNRRLAGMGLRPYTSKYE